ncbi:MAG TPA: cytochrome P450 [Mycobacterium sp.]|nr:cytochrome P450 [Mycobacterium sp.]HQC78061.1 cytochrome P450 [Mycobacterium sp.]
MTEAPALSQPVLAEPNLPPSPKMPPALGAAAFVFQRRGTVARWVRTVGRAVTVRIPVFGDTVIVADPVLAKRIFTTSPEVLHDIQPNLSRILGKGSVFALDGADHRRRRKLLTPPFHGKSIAAYERIVEEETMREMATWPEGKEFKTLEPMMRITLNVILRAVFGADGAEMQQLRDLMPEWVTLGSRLAVLPSPAPDSRWFTRPGWWSPWARLAGYRRTYEALIDRLIDKARADPHFEDRTDILAVFLRASYDDGSAMTRGEIGDELLTLLAAGHETTASTLGWAFERISRHPQVLAKLVAEAAGDDNTYRQAAIFEIQRNRTVIDFAGRHVAAPMYELGDYRLPQGFSIIISLGQLHADPDVYPEPDRFDPQRFIDEKPNTFSWVPFGGGTRRCVGAAFANMELDVVLRTVLRHFTVQITDAPGEKRHNRGVAFTPKAGGRVTVYRRPAPVA